MTTPRDLGELARFPQMNPNPVLRLDLGGIVVMANAAAYEVFGADLEGLRWQDICPGMNDALWHQVLTSEGLVPVDVGVGDRDYVFTHRRDDVDADVFVFGADVTKLRAHERLLEEVARFPDMNPAPVLRLDLEGNVLLANRAATDVFGESLVGRSWIDVCPAMTIELWPAMVDATTPAPIEAQVGERDFVFAHRRDTEADLVFVFGADITQQKQAEQAMRQTEKMAALGKLSAGLAHELNNPAAAAGRAAAHLVRAVADLEEAALELARSRPDEDAWAFLTECRSALAEQGGGAPVVSGLEAVDREHEIEVWLERHGLDEPAGLAAGLAAAGLARGDLEELAVRLPADQVRRAIAWLYRSLEVSELAGAVARSSQAISDLIGVVRSYSYMDQAPVQDVDVHRGIEDTLTILGYKLHEKQIAVVRDYDSELPPLPARGSELNQVWTNLIDNAVDAMAPGGKLTIRTRLDDTGVAVDVEDDGPGIPADLQPSIFDPFFTTKEVGEGTGLGLDVVRRIVTDRSGGSIELRSKPGETVFRVWLPLAAEKG